LTELKSSAAPLVSLWPMTRHRPGADESIDAAIQIDRHQPGGDERGRRQHINKNQHQQFAGIVDEPVITGIDGDRAHDIADLDVFMTTQTTLIRHQRINVATTLGQRLPGRPVRMLFPVPGSSAAAKSPYSDSPDRHDRNRCATANPPAIGRALGERDDLIALPALVHQLKHIGEGQPRQPTIAKTPPSASCGRQSRKTANTPRPTMITDTARRPAK
jgi:hypothetical protein